MSTNKIHVKLNFGKVKYDVGTLYSSEKAKSNLFSYNDEFVNSDIEISPMNMPLEKGKTYAANSDPDLYNLHHVFADALPDYWGKKVQDREFEKHNISDYSSLDRLAYVGENGVGAFQFFPAKEFKQGEKITNIADIRKNTQKIITGDINNVPDDLLKIGGSAGGARAKFLIDYNPNNGLMRYSQNVHDSGFIPVVLKVSNDAGDIVGLYQRIEYCYSLMAKKTGMEIPETYLIEDDKGIAAYAIERFDIKPSGERFHMHTLAGFMGRNFHNMDINYNDLMLTLENYSSKSNIDKCEAYRRAVFNFIAVNQDDHGKNFSLILNYAGEWSLSPAYDMSYSLIHNRNSHAMSLNNRSESITYNDLKAFAELHSINNYQNIIEETINGISYWSKLAKDNGVPEKKAESIRNLIEPNINRIEKEMYRTLKGRSSSPEWFKYTFKKTSKAVTVFGLKQDPENAYRIGIDDGYYKTWKRDSKTGEFKEIPNLNSKNRDAFIKLVEGIFKHNMTKEKDKSIDIGMDI